MTRLAEKPVLHGRDHCPGGADPIPCLQTGGAPGDFETTVLSIPDLLAYWRLGETAGPWLDTSGVGTAANLTQTGSGTALTADVTGALAAGDDGALEFNYDGVATSGGRYAQNTAAIKDFDFNATHGQMTVAAWVKVKPSALTRRGQIIGNMTFLGSIPGQLVGWGLQVVYPARTVRFTRGQPTGGAERYAETVGGVVAGDWNLFVGTYDGATIRLYANGSLVASTADTSGVDYALGDIVEIGYGLTGSSTATNAAYLYGTVDEAALWTRALTADEIEALYTAGVDTGGSSSSAGSQVLVSDGNGGFKWGQANGDAIEDEAVRNKHVAADADIAPTKLQHPGGTTTFLRADGTWATPAGGGGGGTPSTDTQVWMPLTTVVSSVPELVWDASNSLIPTLTPI